MDEYQFWKLFAAALITVVLTIGGCTANDTYQQRVFKQTAIEKGMPGLEIACAWGSVNKDSPTCAILATK